MFFHVVATAANNVIGNKGKLPWKVPADLEWFRQLTFGHPVIMGRKTFESIGRKALEGRANYIVSHYGFTLKEALTEVQDEARVFIIGGETIFEQTMDIVHGIFMTKFDAEFAGDKFYPKIPENILLKAEKTSIVANELGTPKVLKMKIQYYEREWKE